MYMNESSILNLRIAYFEQHSFSLLKFLFCMDQVCIVVGFGGRCLIYK